MKFGRNLQSIIIAIALFTALIVFSLAMVYPSVKKMLDKKQALYKKQTELENVRNTMVKGSQQFKKEFNALEKEYESLQERLPVKSSFPELLNQISLHTEKLSKEVVAINKLEKQEDEDLKVMRIPVLIDLNSDYKTLGDYLNALEGVDIAVTIKRLMIIKDEKNLVSPNLRINIELETYVSLVN